MQQLTLAFAYFYGYLRIRMYNNLQLLFLCTIIYIIYDDSIYNWYKV